MSDLLRERFPTANELVAERHGAPTLVEEVSCLNCTALLIQDNGERWVHLEGGTCTHAVPHRRERAG